MTIDWWTLGFEIVNVAVLIWLLGRFFWRPVSAMIEERRAKSAAMLDDAAKKQAEAGATLEEIRKTRAGLAAEHEQAVAQARKEAEAARASILDTARKEADAVKSSAEAGIKARQAAEQKAWTDRSSRLAVDIAGRLAGRLDRPVVREAFLDWLVATIGDLPDKTRKAVTEDGAALEAVSASDLTDDEQKRIRDAVAAAFGTAPTITFKTEPALIAGLELHGPHLSVANSWRADLERIEAELTRGQ